MLIFLHSFFTCSYKVGAAPPKFSFLYVNWRKMSVAKKVGGGGAAPPKFSFLYANLRKMSVARKRMCVCVGGGGNRPPSCFVPDSQWGFSFSICIACIIHVWLNFGVLSKSRYCIVLSACYILYQGECRLIVFYIYITRTISAKLFYIYISRVPM